MRTPKTPTDKQRMPQSTSDEELKELVAEALLLEAIKRRNPEVAKMVAAQEAQKQSA